MPRLLSISVLAGGAAAGLYLSASVNRDDPHRPRSGATERVIFGAGCFWGVEARFSQVPGVIRTRTGYCGGTTANPTYEAVCSHRTGHAEVVEVEYDPARVAFDGLLAVFWACHDPTKPVRPGGGGQYRSALFFTTPEQEQTARRSVAKLELELAGDAKRVIRTEIAPAPTFYPAEDYHQKYYERARACKLP